MSDFPKSGHIYQQGYVEPQHTKQVSLSNFDGVH